MQKALKFHLGVLVWFCCVALACANGGVTGGSSDNREDGSCSFFQVFYGLSKRHWLAMGIVVAMLVLYGILNTSTSIYDRWEAKQSLRWYNRIICAESRGTDLKKLNVGVQDLRPYECFDDKALTPERVVGGWWSLANYALHNYHKLAMFIDGWRSPGRRMSIATYSKARRHAVLFTSLSTISVAAAVTVYRLRLDDSKSAAFRALSGLNATATPAAASEPTARYIVWIIAGVAGALIAGPTNWLLDFIFRRSTRWPEDAYYAMVRFYLQNAPIPFSECPDYYEERKLKASLERGGAPRTDSLVTRPGEQLPPDTLLTQLHDCVASHCVTSMDGLRVEPSIQAVDASLTDSQTRFAAQSSSAAKKLEFKDPWRWVPRRFAFGNYLDAPSSLQKGNFNAAMTYFGSFRQIPQGRLPFLPLGFYVLLSVLLGCAGGVGMYYLRKGIVDAFYIAVAIVLGMTAWRVQGWSRYRGSPPISLFSKTPVGNVLSKVLRVIFFNGSEGLVAWTCGLIMILSAGYIAHVYGANGKLVGISMVIALVEFCVCYYVVYFFGGQSFFASVLMTVFIGVSTTICALVARDELSDLVCGKYRPLELPVFWQWIYFVLPCLVLLSLNYFYWFRELGAPRLPAWFGTFFWIFATIFHFGSALVSLLYIGRIAEEYVYDFLFGICFGVLVDVFVFDLFKILLLSIVWTVVSYHKIHQLALEDLRTQFDSYDINSDATLDLGELVDLFIGMGLQLPSPAKITEAKKNVAVRLGLDLTDKNVMAEIDSNILTWDDFVELCRMVGVFGNRNQKTYGATIGSLRRQIYSDFCRMHPDESDTVSFNDVYCALVDRKVLGLSESDVEQLCRTAKQRTRALSDSYTEAPENRLSFDEFVTFVKVFRRQHKGRRESTFCFDPTFDVEGAYDTADDCASKQSGPSSVKFSNTTTFLRPVPPTAAAAATATRQRSASFSDGQFMLTGGKLMTTLDDDDDASPPFPPPLPTTASGPGPAAKSLGDK